MISFFPIVPLRAQVWLLLLAAGGFGGVGGVCAAEAPEGRGARRSLAQVLAEEAGELSEPEVRRRVVEELARDERSRREEAEARASERGWPLRGKYPDGGGFELAGVEGDEPLYRTTHNAAAGVSSAANQLWAAPYLLTGAGGTVGVWDEGAVRTTHREFGGRVTVRDGTTTVSPHSTHVAGTIGATGVTSLAKGMAPAVRVDSYDWNSDTSEMTSRGASYPGEPGMLYLSNHSYGFTAGWGYTYTVEGSPVWTWNGIGTTAAGYEPDFGMYGTSANGADALAASLPYYLMFRSAGNDRNNNPAAGVLVKIGAATVAYDAASHPPGDGVYKAGGYDTISYEALGKNVLTVGAVYDATDGSARSLALAALTAFSSWGPADDGRIKPDVVANGYSLYSTSSSGDALYANMSGTSMSSPSAAGTAHLLSEYFRTLFTNTALRASTLKGVLVHTADDLGAAGPDYRFGWGLVNAQAAAELLRGYAARAGTRRVVEDRVTASRRTVSVPFAWDGVSPIRATLCWTDPAGAATTTHDLRTARLVNNLDLRVLGPTGTEYRPWVMPYVGNWSTNLLTAAAVTGSNVTDNVEQVLVAAPGVAGTYTARVSYAGTLTGTGQPFSLLLSGVAETSAAGAPSVSASTPSSATGTSLFTVTGDRFLLGADVRLRRAGARDVVGAGVEAQGDTLRARLVTDGMAEGWWHLTVTNPDGQRAILYNAFVVGTPQTQAAAVWAEDFETADIAGRGWTFEAASGTSLWGLSTAKSVSPTRAMFSAGVATVSDTRVLSATVPIPATGSGLQLSFWHDFALESNDGGVLEFSLDGGAWYDAVGSGSGASFTANGYNATIGGATGKPSTQNPLAGRSGWTGASGGFVKVTVALTDTARYAGHSLRVRWRLGTNGSAASAGWTIDDVSLSGMMPPDMTRGTVFGVR